MAARRLAVGGAEAGPGGGPARSLLTLYELSTGYRVLYSGVLLFFVVGHGVGLLQHALQAGLTPGATADWWLGNAGDPDAARLLFAKEPHRVLDAVWRRTLSNVIPAVVVVALLFRSSLAAPAFRVAASALGAAALLDLASPALVRWGGRAWGWPALGAQVTLFAAVAVSAGVCWADMWLRPDAGPRFRSEGGRAG